MNDKTDFTKKKKQINKNAQINKLCPLVFVRRPAKPLSSKKPIKKKLTKKKTLGRVIHHYFS